MSACGMTPPRPKKSQGNLLSWLQDIYLYICLGDQGWRVRPWPRRFPDARIHIQGAK